MKRLISIAVHTLLATCHVITAYAQETPPVALDPAEKQIGPPARPMPLSNESNPSQLKAPGQPLFPGGDTGHRPPLPADAIRSPQHVYGGNFIFAFSKEKRDVIWGFSKITGKWTTQSIEPPAKDPLQPIVSGDVGVLCVEQKIYAFSGQTARWDVLLVPEGRKPVIQVDDDMVFVQDGEAVYTFSNSTGRWTSPDDPKSVDAASSRPATEILKIFSLVHLDAKAAAGIVSQLFGRDSLAVAVDARGNTVIARGAEAKLAVVEALLLRLDEEPTGNAATRTPFAEPKSSTDAESASAQYRDLEKQAAQMTAEYQQLRAKYADSHPQVKALKDRLRQQVSAAFEARQQWQNAELGRLRARLAAIEESLSARERIKDTIIDRRVEELLDPDLQWEPQSSKPTAGDRLRPAMGRIRPDDRYSRIYNVGDLLVTNSRSEADVLAQQDTQDIVATTAALVVLVRKIKADVLPDTWTDAGGSATIEGFPTNLSLVVSHSENGLQAVGDYLNELRRRRGKVPEPTQSPETRPQEPRTSESPPSATVPETGSRPDAALEESLQPFQGRWQFESVFMDIQARESRDYHELRFEGRQFVFSYLDVPPMSGVIKSIDATEIPAAIDMEYYRPDPSVPETGMRKLVVPAIFKFEGDRLTIARPTQVNSLFWPECDTTLHALFAFLRDSDFLVSQDMAPIGRR